MSKPRFCSQCGGPLRENDRFCGRCGQTVQDLPEKPSPSIPAPQSTPVAPATAPSAPPPPAARPVPSAPPSPPPQPVSATPPPPPPAPAGEMLIGIIPNLSQSTGFLGMKQDSYNLIVTPTRLVFAYVSQQLMKQAVEDARQGARSEGKGFFGQWGAQMGWLSIILQRYQTMPVDSILTEFPGSFIIPTAQVTRVRLKQAQSHDDQPASVPELTIESAAGKSRFRMAGMPMKDARRLLQQVLPHAVK